MSDIALLVTSPIITVSYKTIFDVSDKAYMVSDYLHSHVILSIKVLCKAHRDDKFMRALLGQIEMVITPVLPRDCFYSIDLDFVGDYYLTSKTS